MTALRGEEEEHEEEERETESAQPPWQPLGRRDSDSEAQQLLSSPSVAPRGDATLPTHTNWIAGIRLSETAKTGYIRM